MKIQKIQNSTKNQLKNSSEKCKMKGNVFQFYNLLDNNERCTVSQNMMVLVIEKLKKLTKVLPKNKTLKL